MKERHKVVPAVLFVLERDDRYLFQLRQNTGVWDGLWSMPGGHVEPGEHILQTVAREAKEELGIKVEEANIHLLGFHHYRRNDGNDGLNLYFKITRWSGEPRNTDPHHCADMQWFSPDAFPLNLHPEFPEIIAPKAEHFALEGHFQPRLGYKLN